MPTPIPIIDMMFSVKMLTVVVAAMIDTMPSEIASPSSARISGTPAATIEPNATMRITSVIGNAIRSARDRSLVVVSWNCL